MTPHTYLVVANAYPSKAKLYRNGFIHQRVLAYKSAGHDVRVFYFHPPAAGKPYEYTYDGVEVHVGDRAALQEHLLSTAYRKYLVHFPLRDMVEPILEHHPSAPIIAWLHGFETEAWHRRWFNFVQDPVALREAVQRDETYFQGQLAFLNELYASSSVNLQTVQISEWFARHISEPDIGARAAATEYIPNYIDSERFGFDDKDPALRMKFLSIRPYASWKYANDITQRAILELSRKPYFKDLQFTLLGDGPLFDQVTDPLRSFDNVTIKKGFLRPDDISAYHPEHGVFLAPTRFDSQGVSMCEAMSSGLVPIATNVTAIPDFVEHGVSGLLGAPESIDDIVNFVDALYFDRDLFHDLSRGAAERVRAQCGWSATIGRELELIER